MSDFVTCKAPAGGLAPKYIPFPAMRSGRQRLLTKTAIPWTLVIHWTLQPLDENRQSPRSTSVLKEQLVP